MRKALLAAALALAGAGAASLIASSDARAYNPSDLPGLGYSVAVTDLGNGCHGWAAAYGNALPRTDLGSDCDSGFQQRLDDFVRATCPCAQPPPTTTAVSPTTTDAPAPTPPPPTTTVMDPVPAPPVTVTDTTVTTTTTAPDPISELQRQIDELRQQIVALTDRVARLERAVDAAWLAYEQQVASGADAATAAAIARATYLNAINQIGAFSP